MIIYTDGSCQGNPGPGGFGVVILDNNENFIDCYSERCAATTNNREELKAINWALVNYGKISRDWAQPNIVYSDSAYCVNTYNNWINGWKSRGWKKANKQTPENLDLIQEYDNYNMNDYEIDLRKIKGHAGHVWNELADSLATGKMNVDEVRRKYNRK